MIDQNEQNILLLKLILYSVNVLTQISLVIAIEHGWSAEGTCFCRLDAKQPMPLSWMWLICTNCRPTVFIISNDTPAIHSKLIKIFELLFICVCIWFWSYQLYFWLLMIKCQEMLVIICTRTHLFVFASWKYKLTLVLIVRSLCGWISLIYTS